MQEWRFTIPAGTAIDESSNFTDDVTFTATVPDGDYDVILDVLSRGVLIYAELVPEPEPASMSLGGYSRETSRA